MTWLVGYRDLEGLRGILGLEPRKCSREVTPRRVDRREIPGGLKFQGPSPQEMKIRAEEVPRGVIK